MYSFLIYLVQVNIAIVLFYLLYITVLKRDTFLLVRRIFFLSAILFSLLYPLFVIPAFGEMWNFRSNSLEKVNSTVIFEKPAMVLATEEPTSLPSFAISWEQVLTAIFGVGTLFFLLLRFFWQLISIMRIRLNCEKV